jgi:DNA-binding transcriptional ArsR family regulator
MEKEKLVLTFKALAHPIRLAIVENLLEGEKIKKFFIQ